MHAVKDGGTVADPDVVVDYNAPLSGRLPHRKAEHENLEGKGRHAIKGMLVVGNKRYVASYGTKCSNLNSGIRCRCDDANRAIRKSTYGNIRNSDRVIDQINSVITVPLFPS